MRDALDGQLKADAMRLLKLVMTSDSARLCPEWTNQAPVSHEHRGQVAGRGVTGTNFWHRPH